jgi:hypothetical protein
MLLRAGGRTGKLCRPKNKRVLFSPPLSAPTSSLQHRYAETALRPFDRIFCALSKGRCCFVALCGRDHWAGSTVTGTIFPNSIHNSTNILLSSDSVHCNERFAKKRLKNGPVSASLQPRQSRGGARFSNFFEKSWCQRVPGLLCAQSHRTSFAGPSGEIISY